MDEAAFIRTIIDNPDDDAPRKVYADWLEERGDCPRAEFIRVQCEQARLEATLPLLFQAIDINFRLELAEADSFRVTDAEIRTRDLPRPGLADALAPGGNWVRGEIYEIAAQGPRFDGWPMHQAKMRVKEFGQGLPAGRAELAPLLERSAELLREYREEWEAPIQPAGPSKVCAKSVRSGGLALTQGRTFVSCANHTGDDALVEIRGPRGLQSQFVVRNWATLQVPILGPLQCGDLITMAAPSGAVQLLAGDRFECAWRRGFVEAVTCTRDCWLEYWRRIYDSMPLRSVCLTDRTPYGDSPADFVAFRATWGRIRDWPPPPGDFRNTAVALGVLAPITGELLADAVDLTPLLPLASSPSP